MNNCLKTTVSFLLTHSEDSQQRRGQWSVILSSQTLSRQCMTTNKNSTFHLQVIFFPREISKYVRWKSHKFNFGTHTQLDPKFRQIEKSQICVHLKKNTETREPNCKTSKRFKTKYDNVHFYYVLQTFDQITTGTSKSFKTAKACTNPRKIVATKKEVQRARP